MGISKQVCNDVNEPRQVCNDVPEEVCDNVPATVTKYVDENNAPMLVQGNVLQQPGKSVQMLSSRFQGRLMKQNARLNTPKSVANPVVVDTETDVIFKLLCRISVDLK